ncbi:MAG: signal peptidase II [Anaerolineae bacterium]|nr:signal peptidase II [Anaerolineae bacterium]
MRDQPHTSESSPKSSPKRWLWLVSLALVVILIDQLTKAYVVAHLDYRDSWVPIKAIESIFRFTHVHNTGAAFGIFPDGGSVFLIIAAFVSVIILIYYHQIPDGAWLARIALGLQLGGALGNVVDRVRVGYVVDFFDVSIWPVFNVADSCIVIGVALLMLEMLREEWQMKQAAKHAEQHDTASERADHEGVYS